MMTEREKELIKAYFMTQTLRLDQEYIELRNRLRFRHIDISDNLEMILIQQKIADFQEFRLVIERLLNLR